MRFMTTPNIPKEFLKKLRRDFASMGGEARRDSLTPERRTQIARIAGRARGRQMKLAAKQAKRNGNGS